MLSLRRSKGSFSGNLMLSSADWLMVAQVNGGQDASKPEPKSKITSYSPPTTAVKDSGR